MVYLVLQALTPIVFVVGLGWIAGATGAMPEAATATLARFVIRFALPIALFLAAARADPAQMFHPAFMGALAAGILGVYAVGYVAARGAFRHSSGTAGLQALACSFPNMAYCGPPVLLAAVGAGGMLAVVVGNLLVTLLAVPLTLVLLAAGVKADRTRGLLAVLWGAVRQPLVFMPAAGAVWALLRLPTPALAVAALDEVGRASAGVALFTLGLILCRARVVLTREVLFNVGMKNVVQPTIILAAGWALGLRGPMLAMAFLTGVLPSATEVPTPSIAHGNYAREAAATTLLSTFFAVISITVGIAVSAQLGVRAA